MILPSVGTPAVQEAIREALPTRRKSEGWKAYIVDKSGISTTVHFTVGFYPDGRIGELWIDMHKQGAALRDWSGMTAMMFSIMLQYGVPLKTVLDFCIDFSSEPAGSVKPSGEGGGQTRVRKCTSVVDMIAKTIAIEYLGREDLADVPYGASK